MFSSENSSISPKKQKSANEEVIEQKFTDKTLQNSYKLQLFKW